jgi:hypothetical protein
MLHGHLDAVISLGFIEGWAYDSEHLTQAVEVSVLSGDAEVAWGLAHRFREDLMLAGCGLGWCAFRLRLDAARDLVQGAVLRLLERRSGREIHRSEAIALKEDGETPLETLEELTLADPTIIQGIWQLKRCEPLLMQFIRRQGVESFLSTAYAYVLGRPADANGIALYTRHIRHATLGPVGILEALANSEEFRASSRLLAAPNSPSFPFA